MELQVFGRAEELEGLTMVSDRIEQDIYIAAPVARVWEVVTEPRHVGMWFGNGEPAEVDLRPGGRIVFDQGEQGKLPAVIEKIEEPDHLSFRWAVVDGGGGEPEVGNSTLVEITLEPEGDGTRLRVVESGFSEVEAATEVKERTYKANKGGWGRALLVLSKYSEYEEHEWVE
jgi:uncharacterized protein YndB with AHSA1/START domain